MASGIYDVGGGKRVTIVSPDSAFVGKYAPDGSWNVVVNTAGFGRYWKNGALRVNPSSSPSVYNPDGSMSGYLSTTSLGSAVYFENYSPYRPTYDTDALAFFSRLTVQPDAARKVIYNTLFVELKASGAWFVRDFYHVIGPDVQATGFNLRSTSYTLTPYNSPVFTADRQYMGDGTGVSLGTNATTTAMTYFTQDSANIAGWSGPLAGANNSYIVGAVPSSNVRVGPNTAAGVATGRVNGSSEITGAVTSSEGWTSINRSGASAVQLFKDGVQLSTGATASVALLSGEFRYLRDGGFYRASGWLAGAGGGSLTLAQHTGEASAIRNYLIAIGAYTP